MDRAPPWRYWEESHTSICRPSAGAAGLGSSLVSCDSAVAAGSGGQNLLTPKSGLGGNLSWSLWTDGGLACELTFHFDDLLSESGLKEQHL